MTGREPAFARAASLPAGFTSVDAITHVEITPATTPDDNMLKTIHAALAGKELLPQDHLVDCGYTDAEVFVRSKEEYRVTVIGPVAADPSWQAREGNGYET